MRTYLLLVLALLAAPAPAGAVEWGATVGATGGGPTVEAGPAVRWSPAGVTLDGGLTVGTSWGYQLIGMHAYAAHPQARGLHIGAGLRSEYIFDDGTRTFRLGPSAALGWRNETLELSLRPTLYFIGLGPALGAFVTWWP